MAAHTPGPWAIAPHSDTDEVVNVVAGYSEREEDGRTIKTAHWIAELDAGVDFGDDTEALLNEINANAYLISAAPELLQVARYVIEYFGNEPIDAILDSDIRLRDSARAAIAKAEGRDA